MTAQMLAERLEGETPVTFTCLSCSVEFLSAEEQRTHYGSDYHRYNMKRRVASLTPVSDAVFQQKVLERRAHTTNTPAPGPSFCKLCRKTYATENAYRSHVKSKKHKEIELTAQAGPPPPRPPSEDVKKSVGSADDHVKGEIIDDIDEKITAAGSVLSPNDCLFCPLVSISLESNLTHMSSRHSFFIPDAEYLIDITGLITYLGEKIAVGNVCMYCNDKSRDFRTLEAVRKHMIDKSHCKIAYQSEYDRLEISDYYDFSSSYPDNAEEDGWEDVGDDEPVDDVAVDQEDIEDDVPSNQITFGDSHLELVLPSGTRIGHRSMRHYYNQSPLTSRAGNQGGANSGAAIVRQLLADRNSALVPRRGGFGAFGSGTDVVRARNRGEAREAGRHVREFRDQKRREDFKMRVGLIHNAQKHFRDPLLQ